MNKRFLIDSFVTVMIYLIAGSISILSFFGMLELYKISPFIFFTSGIIFIIISSTFIIYLNKMEDEMEK
jgi:hypothetical protein